MTQVEPKEKSREELLSEISELRTELNDMRLTLEAVTEHSDEMEANLLKKVMAGDKLFHIISGTIPVPFLITNRATARILFSNEHASKLFGYTFETFSTMKSMDLYENPEDRELLVEQLNEYGRVDNFEVKMKKSDGSILYVSLFSQPITYKDQPCLLTVNYDLTERKRSEEEKLFLERQLRQIQKMEAIGTLASGIAHDFNNILAIIFGKTELSLMLLPEDSKVKKHLNDLLVAANRGKIMITQILTFCHQTEQERKPFGIGTIVSEAAKMIQTFTPPHINVTISIESKSSIILGDPAQLYQVLMNLCSNASYVLRERGGTIEIILDDIQPTETDRKSMASSKPLTYVRLTVKDNGPGIEKGIIERMFDPFFTTKKPGEGTGMGLAIVHGIIQKHGGFIRVESVLGKGTAFHCYFPVITHLGYDSSHSTSGNPIQRGSERILFMDNERFILEAYSDLLKSLGYDIVSLADSYQALQLFKEKKDEFDLVILDNILPGVAGKVLAEEIFRIRPDIPIILSMASEDIENNGKLPTGVKDILVKPFSKKQISEKIRKVLDRIHTSTQK